MRIRINTFKDKTMQYLDEYEPVRIPALGIKYHVVWSSNGVVGVCCKINPDGTVLLIRHKSRTLFRSPVAIKDLRHLHRVSARLKSGEVTEEYVNKHERHCSNALWNMIKYRNRLSDDEKPKQTLP